MSDRAGDALRPPVRAARTALFVSCLALATGGCRLPKPRYIGPQDVEPARALEQDTTVAPPAPDDAFPPEPTTRKTFEWIRLTNGEWLKGELSEIRDESVIFESDELGNLTLDWDDVAELHIPRDAGVLLDGARIADGPTRVRGDLVEVATKDGTLRIWRDEVLAIVPGGSPGQTRWDGKVSIGGTFQSGNTDQTDLSASAEFHRRTAMTHLQASYRGIESRVRGAEVSNNHRADGKLDAYLTRRWFLTPFSMDVFRDHFQNIDLRVTPGAGFGYKLVDRMSTKGDADWVVTGGLGYRYTRFLSVQPGSPETDTVASLLLGTRFDADVTRSLEWKFQYDAQVALREIGTTNQHLETTASLDVIGDLDFDVTFIWDRIGNPVEGSDGTTPEPDDFRLIVGLGWEF